MIPGGWGCGYQGLEASAASQEQRPRGDHGEGSSRPRTNGGLSPEKRVREGIWDSVSVGDGADEVPGNGFQPPPLTSMHVYLNRKRTEGRFPGSLCLLSLHLWTLFSSCSRGRMSGVQSPGAHAGSLEAAGGPSCRSRGWTDLVDSRHHQDMMPCAPGPGCRQNSEPST